MTRAARVQSSAKKLRPLLPRPSPFQAPNGDDKSQVAPLREYKERALTPPLTKRDSSDNITERLTAFKNTWRNTLQATQDRKLTKARFDLLSERSGAVWNSFEEVFWSLGLEWIPDNELDDEPLATDNKLSPDGSFLDVLTGGRNGGMLGSGRTAHRRNFTNETARSLFTLCTALSGLGPELETKRARDSAEYEMFIRKGCALARGIRHIMDDSLPASTGPAPAYKCSRSPTPTVGINLGNECTMSTCDADARSPKSARKANTRSRKAFVRTRPESLTFLSSLAFSADVTMKTEDADESSPAVLLEPEGPRESMSGAKMMTEEPGEATPSVTVEMACFPD